MLRRGLPLREREKEYANLIPGLQSRDDNRRPERRAHSRTQRCGAARQGGNADGLRLAGGGDEAPPGLDACPRDDDRRGQAGYGLDRDSELKMLRAIEWAGADHAVDVSATFMGAHAVPPEFDGAPGYVECLIREVLPEASRHASAADIFLERGAFEVTESRRYFEACRPPPTPPTFSA